MQRIITLMMEFLWRPSGIFKTFAICALHWGSRDKCFSFFQAMNWACVYMQVVGGHYWITWLVFWTLACIQSWWHGPESHCAIHEHVLNNVSEMKLFAPKWPTLFIHDRLVNPILIVTCLWARTFSDPSYCHVILDLGHFSCRIIVHHGIVNWSKM